MKYSDVDVINIRQNMEYLNTKVSSLIDTNQQLISSFSQYNWKSTSKNTIEGKLNAYSNRFSDLSNYFEKSLSLINLIERYQTISNEMQRCQNERSRLLNEKSKTGIVGDLQIDYQINQLNIKINECDRLINDLDMQINSIEI